MGLRSTKHTHQSFVDGCYPCELRAENERQRREITTWGRMWDDVDLLEARVEALRNGTAILGSPKDG